MRPVEPAFVAIGICTAFGAVAWLMPKVAAWLEGVDRRQAIRLAASGWSIGQIAHRQFRNPAQIARWLADADRKRPS